MLREQEIPAVFDPEWKGREGLLVTVLGQEQLPSGRPRGWLIAQGGDVCDLYAVKEQVFAPPYEAVQTPHHSGAAS